jgi:hypothetical protein
MKLPVSDFRSRIGPAAAPRGCGSPQIVNRKSKIANPEAFSLVEIIIVAGLLSIILLGLMAMFGQTQRAFRTGMTQTDVLESGRMATDMIVRELEQVTPSYQYGPKPGWSIQPNFYSEFTGAAPLSQTLPGSSRLRTNRLEDLFFVMRRNQEWIGIGYFVRNSNPTNGLLSWPLVGTPPPMTLGAGTLYRFETHAPVLSGRTPGAMFGEFLGAALEQRPDTRASKIVEGVVQFRVWPYDPNGMCITNGLLTPSGFNPDVTMSDNRAPNNVPGEVVRYIFYSNAVPASVELELGILEDRAWERFKSLPDTASQLRYLTNQAGRVHLFRQRISIRNVDPLAYR